MSAPAVLRRLLSGVRRRVVLDATLAWMPWTLAATVASGRLWGGVGACVAGLAVLLVAAIATMRRLAGFDRAWLVSRLDAARRDLDDSSGLLLRDEAGLGPLQRLQRARVATRLEATAPPDLRPAWSVRAIALCWAGSCALALAAWFWPAAVSPTAARAGDRIATRAVPGEPRLRTQALHVQPPAYTGLRATRGAALDAKAPIGSLLRWRLRYAPQPAAVEIVLHDGRRLPMARDGEDWTASLALRASTLYRVVPAGVAGAQDAKLHRLDAVPDLPPRIRVLAPERGLTLLEDGQRTWRLQFEAADDHGVAARARLQLTRTEGSGENLRFHDHVLVLAGRGDRRTKRFTATLSPSDYGLQRGEDLVARLEVLDNRVPQPQLSRSASVILRWPAEPVLGADGLDGLARQVLPAYFRSQRQIIIDAEALLKARPGLAAEEFERRSDAIGVDQRLLRLRYGQFLGEESEGGRAPPTSDLPTSDLPAEDEHDDEHDEAHETLPDHADGPAPSEDHAHAHDEADPGTDAPRGFGDAGDVLETFGHTHDIAEAATLLDPQTKETLRAALREMWQSELHLRQAAPAQALPYAYRALELVKQVQQADRIYLQRVGTQLPPIDEGRRLTGKREGIADRPLPRLPSADGDGPVAAAWSSLETTDAQALAATLDALQAWVDANRDRVADPLEWIARIDELRRDPDCADCRDALRTLLWSGLPRPAGGISRRSGDDAAARRYLDALRGRGEAR